MPSSSTITDSPVPIAEELDCIKRWEDQLKVIQQKLSPALSATNNMKTALARAANWELALKSYFEKIQISNEKIKTIGAELDLFVQKARTTHNCSKETVVALKVLGCMVEQYFNCIDLLDDKLKKTLNLMKGANIDLGKSIVWARLDSYSKKFLLAIQKQEMIITETFNVILLAIQLEEALWTPAESGTGKLSDFCGLGNMLKDLHLQFDAKEQPHTVSTDPISAAPSAAVSCVENPETLASCTAKIEPVPSLPLTTEVEAYKHQYEKAKEEREELEDKYKTNRECSESLQSEEKGLREALKAAKEAGAC